MKKQILRIVIPLLFVCACKTPKKASTDGPITSEVITDDLFRKPINDKDLYQVTNVAVPLDTIYVSKDTLNIITKKITGCETENFKLIWNGDFGATHPPQTSLKLFQYVAGDCRERHKFHLMYNISSLKLKNDTAVVKTTLITVGGWSKTTNYIHN